MTELNGSEILSNMMDELERFTDMTEDMEETDEMLKDELLADIASDSDRFSEIKDDILKVAEDIEINLFINNGHSIEKTTGDLFLNLVENNVLAVYDVLSPVEHDADKNSMDKLMADISDCIRTYPEYKDSLDAVLKKISPEQQKENDIQER